MARLIDATSEPSFTRTYVTEIKWAHPLWSHYAFLLYDLTTPIAGMPEPLVLREGMTHELMVYALDPKHPPEAPLRLLMPPNHGYQFPAGSNFEADARVVDLITKCENAIIGIDTDFRAMWDAQFRDGVTLHK